MNEKTAKLIGKASRKNKRRARELKDAWMDLPRGKKNMVRRMLKRQVAGDKDAKYQLQKSN